MPGNTALAAVLLSVFLMSIVHCGHSEEGVCTKSDDGVKCSEDNSVRLTRLNGELVGNVQTITDGDRKLEMKTLNMKPLVFEIENFLTEEECDYIKAAAVKTGLESSQTMAHSMSKNQNVDLMDLNHDGELDIMEMKITIENGYDIFLEKEDILDMYSTLELDTNGDTHISRKELSKIKPKDLFTYLHKVVADHPEKHSRYSSQAWLDWDKVEDEVYERIQERTAKVTHMPIELIRLSDVQVVRYGIDGHYNAHTDSSPLDEHVPCCQEGNRRKCRICRYMTILFYLNDVTEGGETAFPYANMEDINETDAHLSEKLHLFKNCEQASLRVAARRGKAIIWYNHFVNEETGWMGEVDEFTMHGGCPIKQGEKWIANIWVKTTDSKEADIANMRALHS